MYTLSLMHSCYCTCSFVYKQVLRITFLNKGMLSKSKRLRAAAVLQVLFRDSVEEEEVGDTYIATNAIFAAQNFMDIYAYMLPTHSIHHWAWQNRQGD